MLNLNSIMLGSQNGKELAAFYEKVIGKAPEMEDGGYYGWMLGSSYLTVYDHSEVKGKSRDPKRLFFNFESKNVKKEFARIKEAGAKVIKAPYEMEGMWIATFADPDGNYFQLMSPWKEK